MSAIEEVVLFGTHIGDRLYVDDEEYHLFGCKAPSARCGFFKIRPWKEYYEVVKFVPVSTEEYYKLCSLGVFDED